MFGSIGMPELIIIFVIALIIFGPRKLPELGRSVGKSLSEFKRASNDLRNTLDEEIKVEEKPPAPPTPAARPSLEDEIEAEQIRPQTASAKPAAEAIPTPESGNSGA